MARLGRRLAPWLLLAAICSGAYQFGQTLRVTTPALTTDTAWAAPQLTTVQKTTVAGVEAGRVLYGSQEVLTLVASAAGLSGLERAAVVSGRINDQIRAGVPGSEFSYLVQPQQIVITGRNTAVLATITQADAQPLGKSLEQLAWEWTNNLRTALGAQPLPTPSGVQTGGGAQAPTGTTGQQTQNGGGLTSEPYRDKYVPIISALQGVSLGIARINGPESAVSKVQAVAQLETNFKSYLEIDVYVPISTKEPGKKLARVQSVGVTGLGDLKL